MKNLFENLEALSRSRQQEERIDVVCERPGARVERIVSMGHQSPPDFWYDQDQDEWVTVLRGRARLELKDPGCIIELGEGDHLLIPAHRKHRVDWTSPEEPTVWLAIFFSDNG